MSSIKPELLQDFKNIQSVKESVSYVLNRVKLKECVSVVSMSGLGKRPYFHTFEDQLQIYKDQYELVFVNTADKTELESVISKLEKDFKPTILLVRLAFEEDCSDLIDRLEKLREKYYTKFISILLANLKTVYSSYTKKPQVLVKSTRIEKPFNYADSIEVLNQYEIKYDLKISSESKDKIAKLSGGHTGILKSLFLIEIDKPNFEPNIAELLLDEGIIRWLRQLVLDLPKNITADIHSNSRSIESDETLKKFGYINENGETFSPIVDAYLKKIKNELKPILPVDIKLSVQEKAVYDLFLSNKNQIVSRDDIAKAIWGENYLDNYSDWSIDQVVYRIRNKMSDAEMSDKITTKKKQGFIYETLS